MVYANLQLPAGTARRSPAGWWSLTPPSHPCQPEGRRLFSSAIACCHQQLPFSEVGCPMLPGLSSRTHRASDRPGFCFHGAKLRKIESRTKRTCSFFMPRWSNLSKVTKNREQDTILSLSGQNHQNLFFYAISIQLCRHTTKKKCGFIIFPNSKVNK